MDDNQSLSSTDRLEAVLYQYVTLYERWSEDRQLFVKKGADISKEIERLHEEVEKLQSVDKAVCRSLANQMQSMVTTVQQEITHTATVETKKSLQLATERLNRIVSEVEHTLKRSVWDVAKSRWQWVGMTFVVVIMSSYLFVTWLLPNNMYQLSHRQIEQMNAGDNFLTLYSKLPKAERDKLWQQFQAVEKKQVSDSY